MAQEFGIKLTADTGQFDRAMGKLESRVNQASQKIESFGKAMTFSITAAFGGLAVKSIQAASALEETQSKFNAVFKNLSGDVRGWATETANALGRGQGDIEGFLASLQDTFVPMGVARNKAAELSKQTTQLALDLASFNNKADADVIRDLQSALVGNTETVRKYGIIINQTTLDQELLNMGIAGGVKTASEAQKLQARLNLIIAGSGDAMGDAARTAGSFANQMRALQARIGDVFEVIGQKLMPIAKAMVGALKDLAQGFLALDNVTQNRFIGIAGLAATMGPLLVLLGKATPLMINFAGGIKRVGLASKAAIVGISTMSIKITAIAAAIGSGLLLGKTLFDTLAEYIDLGPVFDYLSKLFDMLKAKIQPIITAAVELGKALGTIGQDTADIIMKAFDTLDIELPEVPDWATEFAEKFKNNLSNNIDLIKGAGKSVMDGFNDVLSGGKDKAAEILAEIDALLAKNLGSTGAPTYEGSASEEGQQEQPMLAGISLDDGFIKGVENGLLVVEEKVVEASDAILAAEDKINTSLEGMRSMAMTVGEAFGGMFEGLINGSETMGQAVLKAVGKIINALIAQAVAAITAGEMTNKSFLGFGAIALGVAAGAAATAAISSITQFANGGVISGKTLGIMGEYTNAQQNPEVVAPLDKLQNIIGNSGGGGGMLEARITGRQLQLILDRENRARAATFG